MTRKEFNSVRDADGGSKNVALIVTVMMIGWWPNVELLGSVVSPGWMFYCAVVNSNLASSRS